MAGCSVLSVLVIHICLLLGLSFAEDPFVNYEFVVSYITASPLGVPQQVIAINGKFPGPTLNVTTNNNVVVNVRNKLDEGLLIHWSGIQQRRSSWQDGLPGTNCPIPAKWNWTYQFQRASGGFGSIIVNNRDIIPIPFDTPYGDITIVIGDWYTQNHTALRKTLNAGKDLGMPDGVLINGKGPYRYNDTLVPDGIDYETITVHPGKTYRLRVSNVGISTSLNFRIQNHNLLLAETEGSYTVQQNYTSLDIHVGQTYSFLVTMDQNASSDYYIVASARFVNETTWRRVTGVGILHYTNSKGKASGPLPDPPQDQFDKTYSMNQARSIRWNVTASGARPNPQGSFRYGSINVTEVMDYGEWTENSRGTYNKWDGIARTTAQVYPGAWTAILISLDNVGVWNLRTENLDSWYLGQETYVRVINPEPNNKTEFPIPDNALFCGSLSRLQSMPPPPLLQSAF
ncbi:UNVERIFIED_CONTAM: Monocopper oxidase-like protein SKU5 [Sesamum calycinum]|uniref:Monocopper oxidase-like protein SKU5 n=1 Tax=Sesamum calycinum TaxID=2727403 RepID=A0AAW2LZ15_9LAMI